MSRPGWLPGFGEHGQARVEGEVTGITYRHEGSGFAVIRVEPEPGRVVFAVGPLASLLPGERVDLRGRWVDDPTHGRQLQVDRVEVSAPQRIEGLERYLASGVVPGIGKGLASRLVTQLGPRLFEALEGDVATIAAVSGIGPNRARALVEGWARGRHDREVRILLEGLGVGPVLAQRIQSRYGASTPEVLRQDPYRLIDEVPGVGFVRADALAQKMGLAKDSPARGRAAVLHVLDEGTSRGHVALPSPRLLEALGPLDVPEALGAAALDTLAAEGRIVVEADASAPLVYLAWLHRAEVEVAARLLAWPPPLARALTPDHAITEAETHLGLTLGPEQRQAVRLAVEAPLLVVTGGPGTGKTTVIRALTALLAQVPGGLALAAPTGRAARRLAEVTGREASTLHRLLEARPPRLDFGRHPGRPLDHGAVLVDEASMVDLPLLRGLLRAVKPGTRLILVGDADQLPPVGPGEPLRDLVESEAVPVVRLGTLYRQGQGSLIAENAHHIVRGELPRLVRGAASREVDFFFLDTPEAQVPEIVVDLVTRRLPSAYGLDPFTEVQVLCPGHRGDAGTEALNLALKGRLNPTAGGGLRPAPGDRVIQTRNDPERELSNGDLGRVEGAVGEGSAALRVRFDERELLLDGAALDDLDLAYALTVHKSQGSEYPAVVLPLTRPHLRLLQRSLLYTAVTRARRLLVLVGDWGLVVRAVNEGDRGRRFGRLRERLRGTTEPAQAPWAP